MNEWKTVFMYVFYLLCIYFRKAWNLWWAGQTQKARSKRTFAGRLSTPVWMWGSAFCLPWCPSSPKSSSNGCHGGRPRTAPPASQSPLTQIPQRWVWGGHHRISQWSCIIEFPIKCCRVSWSSIIGFCSREESCFVELLRSFQLLYSPSLRFDLQFCWHSEELDHQMEFVMTVVRTIRSLRADYNLTKTRADCKSIAPERPICDGRVLYHDVNKTNPPRNDIIIFNIM